jgi:ACS family hexuronate transporter-like MFS transporter
MAWWILVLSSLASVLSMIDRQTVAVLKTALKARLAIGDAEYGVVVTVFLAGYAAFYVVCGRLVDMFGSRVMLTLFITLWSVAAILSGLARSLPELAAYRFVLGAAEAGLTPATLYALVRWFPRERLATAYGLRGPIIALGPVLATPIIVAVVLALGWRAAFLAPGGVGFVLAAAWWLSDRDAPGDRGEQAPPDPTPFKTVLRSKALWGLVAARLISDPLWFFVQHWQAGYFQEALGFSLAQVGRLLWIPPLASGALAIGVMAGSDRLLRAGRPVVRARVVVMQTAAVLAPLAAAIPLAKGPVAVIALFTLVQLMCLTWLFLSNVLLIAFFGKGAIATAAGVMNAVGTAGAAAFSLFTGAIVERFGYAAIFTIGACLHPAAALVLHIAYRQREPGSRGRATRCVDAGDASVDEGHAARDPGRVSTGPSR